MYACISYSVFLRKKTIFNYKFNCFGIQNSIVSVSYDCICPSIIVKGKIKW